MKLENGVIPWKNGIFPEEGIIDYLRNGCKDDEFSWVVAFTLAFIVCSVLLTPLFYYVIGLPGFLSLLVSELISAVAVAGAMGQ